MRRSLSDAGPTGHPACHDAPSCIALTGATAAWNGGSAGIDAPAYSGPAMLTLALAFALQACPQRIVVTAPALRATTGGLSLLDGGRRVAGPFDARVGVHGLSANRREGDGTTPIGTFGIGPTIYGLDPDP